MQVKNDLKVRPCFNLSKSFQIFLLVVKLGGVFALARVHVSTVLCAPRVREGWLRFGGWFVASGVVRTHVRVRWEGGLASPFRSHILPECCNALAAVTQTDNHTRTRARARTHTQTHTHPPPPTHTHTHTHTLSLSLSLSLSRSVSPSLHTHHTQHSTGLDRLCCKFKCRA